MDIKEQNKTWSNFTKLTLYASLAVIAILVLMALFLL
ncbi:aa3-type cytochrome c oxidase subunit IV [Pelagibacteraceae bacterium]|nr:aa3-type cytochrome c oxidase subunit IV [Pelagibacteraceae bacterium]